MNFKNNKSIQKLRFSDEVSLFFFQEIDMKMLIFQKLRPRLVDEFQKKISRLVFFFEKKSIGKLDILRILIFLMTIHSCYTAATCVGVCLFSMHMLYL